MQTDVAIIGGGLIGSMASVMLGKRGVKSTVLESREMGKEQKIVVGEAITEGSSVFLRHEIGMGDWLKKNAFRKYGFDFLTLPRDGRPVRTMDDCHELLLSLTPLERLPKAHDRLIPTYHVERTGMNAEASRLAKLHGADYLYGASVDRVDFARGPVGDASLPSATVHYTDGGEAKTLKARWVLDCSGRRSVLGNQLGITHTMPELPSAAVWNRFENVRSDRAFWSSFHGIDRRRHTIHMTGHGFWIWWIHQNDNLTSVGVSFDRRLHDPNVKTDDRGFWEMMAKFPPILEALKGARPLEPYQYYAHLPYQSDRWVSGDGYGIIGDAGWFTDALYSIGIETACRQLVAIVPMVKKAVRGEAPNEERIADLNSQFEYCQKTVLSMNKFKYEHGWHRPHVVMQTALYELGEIAPLYHMLDESDWRDEVLMKHYRLQWSCPKRMGKLERFQQDSLLQGDLDLVPGAPLLKKALLPGPYVYGATWPVWNTSRKLVPHFFKLTRAWGFAERLAQKSRWPDVLKMMANNKRWMRPVYRLGDGA